MILALSFGESVVNHFARRFLDLVSSGISEGWATSFAYHFALS